VWSQTSMAEREEASRAIAAGLAARGEEIAALISREVGMPLTLSMTIQAVLFAWIYQTTFASRPSSVGARSLAYAAFGAVLSWSFTTIAVAAKNVMSSVPDYLVIETGFTLVQWIIVGPLTALLLETRTARASLA